MYPGARRPPSGSRRPGAHVLRPCRPHLSLPEDADTDHGGDTHARPSPSAPGLRRLGVSGEPGASAESGSREEPRRPRFQRKLQTPPTWLEMNRTHPRLPRQSGLRGPVTQRGPGGDWHAGRPENRVFPHRCPHGSAALVPSPWHRSQVRRPHSGCLAERAGPGTAGGMAAGSRAGVQGPIPGSPQQDGVCAPDGGASQRHKLTSCLTRRSGVAAGWRRRRRAQPPPGFGFGSGRRH